MGKGAEVVVMMGALVEMIFQARSAMRMEEENKACEGHGARRMCWGSCCAVGQAKWRFRWLMLGSGRCCC